ncbi:MAG: ABC transporter permease [Treponema sp.]|nr:ABC transporter permease [Treponema sp.]
MEKTITVKSLALSNIKKKPYRTAALTILVALASGVLFGTLLLTASIKGGFSGIKNRIGADLMIVPEGYEAQAESVLLSGEPVYFYMDRSIEETVRGIQGVEAVSSQFYLTSLSESCCDFPIQIIGFDPETDFIVRSWSRKKVKSSGTDDEELILAGSNITTEKNNVRFFEHTHNVSARLAKSGTGMDNVIYADINSLQNIFDDAKEKGFGFISDGDTKSKTSVIFVKLAQGVKPDSTVARIKGAVSGIQVIQSDKFVSGLMDSISSFMIFLYAGSIIVVLITVLTLSIVFNLSINERLREFSILRVLGADFKKLRSIVFTEAGFIGSLGAVLGIFLSALILLPFNILISEKLNMPFVLSGAGQLVLFALVTFAVLVSACLVASVSGALKVSKHEVYHGIK